MYGRTFASIVVLFWGLPAHAQELRVVLDDTFASDPQIRIARANTEQTQASLDLARTEGRPRLSLTTYASIETVDPQSFYSRKGGRFGAGIDADVPIFSGGEIRYRIRSARYVRDESLATLDETINARKALAAERYADLIRDIAVVGSNADQLADMAATLNASVERRRHGDLTDTDIHQAAARLATSQASLARARSALTQSQEGVREITGEYVRDASWPETPSVDGDVADLARRLVDAPALRAADARIAGARAVVDIQRSQRLPRLSLTGGIKRANDLDDGQSIAARRFRWSTSVGLTLGIPLFRGGAITARVRQAEAFVSANQWQRAAIERDLTSTIRARYSQLQAAERRAEALSSAVDAAKRAAYGVGLESKEGWRTVLDILNARSEITQNEIALASARSEKVALAYSILSLMGRIPTTVAREITPVTFKRAAPTERVIRIASTPAQIKYPVDALGLWTWQGSTTWSLAPGSHSAGKA
ncbi:TolC family protein [Sphingomonas sp. PP-CC-3A-396]|uniref:TolC family protein n=1 Tax=Sphingomonas sp. PP-CC-3A-396 TaxID=2135655 RepID=UPI00104E99D6|nr:TolC family protein [Sphingomonas sp. PP-CC-3A-396]TCQ03013.1 outer membrane protein [Sphingomonas sp. PP-CC-3A-396]